MTQISRPWAGTTPGDSGPYTDQEWAEAWRSFFTIDPTTQGVLNIPSTGNLEVTNPASTTMRVPDGYAIVHGVWYKNTANYDITAPSGNPSANPRIDVVVLEKDFTAQTVRVAIVEGTEAASPTAPTMTQTDGDIWQIPLAQYQISVLGVISSLTDRRSIAVSSTGGLFKIYDSTLTASAITITISNIPTFFEHLELHISGDVDGADVYNFLDITISGLATAYNYFSSEINDAAAITIMAADNTTYMRAGKVGGSYGIDVSGMSLHMNLYSRGAIGGTSLYETLIAGQFGTSFGTSRRLTTFTGNRFSAVSFPLTSLVLTLNPPPATTQLNWLSGTRIALYGYL